MRLRFFCCSLAAAAFLVALKLSVCLAPVGKGTLPGPMADLAQYLVNWKWAPLTFLAISSLLLLIAATVCRVNSQAFKKGMNQELAELRTDLRDSWTNYKADLEGKDDLARWLLLAVGMSVTTYFLVGRLLSVTTKLLLGRTTVRTVHDRMGQGGPR